MKLSNENIERLKYIHENELLSYIHFITFDEYEEIQIKTKERIKKKLQELKINVGYIIAQYLEEKEDNKNV